MHLLICSALQSENCYKYHRIYINMKYINTIHYILFILLVIIFFK